MKNDVAEFASGFPKIFDNVISLSTKTTLSIGPHLKYPAKAPDVVEIAEFGQRVGEARHGRLGKAGAMGDLLVAEHAFAGVERAQDVEAAGQRGHELPVLAVAGLGEAVVDGTLEGGGPRDEMAHIAHGVCSCSW